MDLVPEHRRDAVRQALRDVFGQAALGEPRAMTGGASGALVCRLPVGERDYVLRVEPERIPVADRARGYECMAAGAAVGAAPGLLLADPVAGVAVMEFIPAQPLAGHPGGEAGLARAFGELIAKVRSAAPFPRLPDYPEVAGWMLRGVEASGLMSAGLLAPHLEALDRIRAILSWPRDAFVPAHNDPNPRNLLFDGSRLWLVDWELAAMNDPLVDIAIGVTEFARTPELEALLVCASFGEPPSRELTARLAVVQLLTRIFYAAIVLDSLKGRLPGPDGSLAAFTPDGFRAAVADRRLASGAPETAYAFAKMSLRAFMDGVAAPGFEETLRIASAA